MARTLGDIPPGTAIVDKFGGILYFFRARWQELQSAFQQTPTVASVALTTQSAAIVTATVYTTPDAGIYRVSWYLRKTIADGVSSSVQITVGWVDHAVSLTESGAAVTTDTVTAQQSGSKVVYADAITDLTYAIAYASNTANKMQYELYVEVEALI